MLCLHVLTFFFYPRSSCIVKMQMVGNYNRYEKQKHDTISLCTTFARNAVINMSVISAKLMLHCWRVFFRRYQISCFYHKSCFLFFLKEGVNQNTSLNHFIPILPNA